MKHPGANMEYAEERLRDLMRAHDQYLASCAYIRMPELYDNIVNSPARRFYVSDTRAAVVISAMLKGKECKRMHPLKREMYQEILRRVMLIRDEHPAWTIAQLCAHAVMQPAPKFYITPGSAKVMVCKARKKWIAEKLRRLRRWQ